MSRFKERSDEVELMDDLNCKGEVVDQTLRELDTINDYLGGNSISIQGLKHLISTKDSTEYKLVDLGCGSGDMLKRFHHWATGNRLHLKLTGIDANPNIIDYARTNLKALQGVNFRTENVLSKSFSERKFDIIHCSLFLHHFKEEELVLLIKNFKRQARIGVIINDLHRHWLAYYSIKLLTQLFSRSAMVKFDAPLSVQRGFKKTELLKILAQAGIEDYSLKWKWAFRWQLVFATDPSLSADMID